MDSLIVITGMPKPMKWGIRTFWTWVGDVPLVVPPANENCVFWNTMMTLLKDSPQVQWLGLSERRLQVLSDLWHITTDHSCREQSPNPAQLEPLKKWLHTPEASVSSDEAAD